jgi:hypothetical protein
MMGKDNTAKKKNNNNNNRLSLRKIKAKQPKNESILHSLLTGPILLNKNEERSHSNFLPSRGPTPSTSSYQARAEAEALAALEHDQAIGRVIHALNERQPTTYVVLQTPLLREPVAMEPVAMEPVAMEPWATLQYSQNQASSSQVGTYFLFKKKTIFFSVFSLFYFHYI